MRVEGEEITGSFEIWSVKRQSTDGAESEIVFDEGEEAARLDHHFFGGHLWVRTAYTTDGHEVMADEPATAD